MASPILPAFLSGLPPAQFAMAYGSGVFEQKGYESALGKEGAGVWWGALAGVEGVGELASLPALAWMCVRTACPRL